MTEQQITRDDARFENALPLTRLLVGACGAIGVAHLPTIIVHLQTVVPDLRIRVVLTENAARMVSPVVLGALTREPVLTRWEDVPSGTVPHIDLLQWAEMVLVLPATANVLAKASVGIADDLLTTTLLSARCPTVFAPSMNARMWEHPAVQRSVAQLRADGAHVVDPVSGYEAAGHGQGTGALPPLRDLLHALAGAMNGHGAGA